MMLVPTISIALGVSFLLLIALFVFARKWIFIAIPLIGLTWFFASTTLPNFVGYAVQDTFVKGQSAMVISVTLGDKEIYLLVKMKGDDEPRFVTIPRNKDNDDQAKQIQQQLQNSPVFIKFGDATNQPDNGNGTNDHSSIQTMTLQEYDSKYAKEPNGTGQ